MEVHAMAKGNLESSQKKNIRKAEGFRFVSSNAPLMKNAFSKTKTKMLLNQNVVF